MKLVFKILLRLAAAVVLLPIIAVLVFFFIISPNRYQQSLEDIAIQQTGLDVNIAGDISWTFRPTLGLTITDVRVKENNAPRELASAAQISLKVGVEDLLRGNLVLNEIRLDRLHINWFTNAEGQSNWRWSELFASDSVPDSNPDFVPGLIPDFVPGSRIQSLISQIHISNATIDIQNLQRNYHVSLDNLNLTSNNANARNIQFPIGATFKLVNHTGEQALNLTLSTTARVDYPTGNAQFDALRVNLTPMELKGSFSLRNFRNQPFWFSNLSSNTFILSDFLDNFREPEIIENAVLAAPSFPVAEIGQTSVQIQLSGDQQRFSVPSLHLHIDQMNIESEANFRYATLSSPSNLNYSITSNALDLRPWFASTQTGNNSNNNLVNPSSGNTSLTPGNEASQSTITDIEIPKDFLTSINIQGSHNIESLLIKQIELTPVNVFVNLEGGILNLEAQPMELFDGIIQGTIQLDSRNEFASLNTQLSAANIDVINLATFYPELQSLKGLVDLESSYSMQGNTLGTLLENISGSSTFNLKQNSIDIAIFKQVFTAISALSPTGTAIQQWPDIIQFGELSGYLLFENGMEENQRLKIRMDNFDIDGYGGINLTDNTFDYEFLFTVLGDTSPQTIRVDSSYHDVNWPVLCAASFSDQTNQYCRPDFPQVREIFLNLPDQDSQQNTDDADSALDSVLDNTIPEQLPEAAKNLLRNLFPFLEPSA